MADVMDTTETKSTEVTEETPAAKDDVETKADVPEADNCEGGEKGADKEAGMSDSEILEDLKTLCAEEGDDGDEQESSQDQDADAAEAEADAEGDEKGEKQEQEFLGPDIDPKIATLVNSMMRTNIDQEKMRSLAKKCRRPANTENLSTPRVNQSVMNQLLDGRARSTDLKMQFMQRNLCQGMAPMVHMLDTLFKVKKGEVNATDVDMSGMLGQCTDSLTMLSQCYNGINHNRRSLLLPYIQDTPKVSFRRQIMREPVQTGYLYSDNIEKAIAEGRLKRKQNMPYSQRQPFTSPRGGRGGGGWRGQGGRGGRGRGGRGRPY